MIERYISMFETLQIKLECAVANDDDDLFTELCEQIDDLSDQYDRLYPTPVAHTLH